MLRKRLNDLLMSCAILILWVAWVLLLFRVQSNIQLSDKGMFYFWIAGLILGLINKFR